MLNTTSLQGYRDRIGITQEELGKAIGVTRQTIAAWENNDRQPSLIQLQKIATELFIPLELLLNDEVDTPTTLLFRADNADILSKETRLLASRLAENYVLIEKLMDETPVVPESRPLEGFDEYLVERVADDTRDWLGVENAPLGDVLARLESRSLKVIKLDLPTEVSGFSAYTDDWGGIIFVNKEHKPERQYFTGLHELGHLIFHRSEYKKPIKKVGRSDPREKVADRFAAAVLLAKEAIIEELRGFGNKWLPEPLLIDIKERYNVSLRTIVYRAKDLNIIPKKQFGQQLGIMLRKYGKYEEPGEVKEPKPLGRLKRLIYLGLLEDKITSSRAAEILGVKLKEIRAELPKWMAPPDAEAIA